MEKETKAVVSPKIQEILEKVRKLQQTEKPFLSYTRHVSWHGQPCDWCNNSKGIREVKGRYAIGDAEDKTLLFSCGLCLPKFEGIFKLMME